MKRHPFLLAAVAAILPAATAHANIVAVFTGNVGNSYNYTLRFRVDQPITADQPGETLRAGDFITIYDVAPIGNISQVFSPTGFAINLNNLGLTPPGLGAPALVDDPGLSNLTFTYQGPTLSASTDFTGAQLITTGNFTGVQPGKDAGTTSLDNLSDQLSLNITRVPAVTGGDIPEPASLALLSLGCVGLLARRRSSQRR